MRTQRPPLGRRISAICAAVLTALVLAGPARVDGATWDETKQRLNDRYPPDQFIRGIGHDAAKRRVADKHARNKLLETLIGYSFTAMPEGPGATPSPLDRPPPDYIQFVVTRDELSPMAGIRQKTYHSKGEGYYSFAWLPINWARSHYERMIDTQLAEALASQKKARRLLQQRRDLQVAKTALAQADEWLKRADVLARIHQGLGGSQSTQTATARAITRLHADAGSMHDHLVAPPGPVAESFWHFGVRLGASVLTGIAGAEVQIRHFAFDLGFVPDWILGGIKLYQRPLRNGWYGAIGGGIRSESDDKKSANIAGIVAGYRWTHPDTYFDASLGVGAGLFTEQDEDIETVAIWDASIGYRF